MRSAFMLRTMWDIVWHGENTESLLHPLRVMHSLHSQDEELNCIALGHDLIRDKNATLVTLQEAGMTGRVLTGIWNLTPAETPEQTMYRICRSEDSMRVAMKIALDDAIHDRNTARAHELYIALDERLKRVQFNRRGY